MIQRGFGIAYYADRGKQVKELAENLMREFPDYKKSQIKHPKPVISLYGRNISRFELRQEQTQLKAKAVAQREERKLMEENMKSQNETKKK